MLWYLQNTVYYPPTTSKQARTWMVNPGFSLDAKSLNGPANRSMWKQAYTNVILHPPRDASWKKGDILLHGCFWTHVPKSFPGIPITTKTSFFNHWNWTVKILQLRWAIIQKLIWKIIKRQQRKGSKSVVINWTDKAIKHQFTCFNLSVHNLFFFGILFTHFLYQDAFPYLLICFYSLLSVFIKSILFIILYAFLSMKFLISDKNTFSMRIIPYVRLSLSMRLDLKWSNTQILIQCIYEF